MSDLPKIAMRRLHQKGTTGVHPDPNLISAFVENSLPLDARAQMLEHMAQCADCREVVFLSSPEQAVTRPAAASAPSAWLTWPVLRWGAAVAAVVVVVAAVTLHRQSGGRSTPSSAIQQADVPMAKEAKGNTAALLAEEKGKSAAVAKTTPAPAETKNDLAVDAKGKRLNEFKKQSSRIAASPMLAQKAEVAVVAGTLADERRDQDELDKTTVDVATQAPTPLESGNGETRQMVPGRAKDAAATPSSSMNGGSGGGVFPATAAAGSQPRAAVLLPTAAPRWTLTSEGTLQRSLDLGRSWQTIQVASQVTFRALAASGRDIWVGGTRGALYHSTDGGQNWMQVLPVSAGQALADDIIGVAFPDSLHGRLTTASKETWTTEDGGQIWHKR